MLKKITLLRDRVEDWNAYPFSVPTIASLTEIDITSRVDLLRRRERDRKIHLAGGDCRALWIWA